VQKIYALIISARMAKFNMNRNSLTCRFGQAHDKNMGFVGLSNILDSIGMEEFRRREPVKRAHRYIVGAILVCS
jgi:hypothetical protein